VPSYVQPPPGARNLVVVVLDSLRYDSWMQAEPEVLARLGAVERRYTYATWTAPSHYNLLMGLLPHTNPVEVYASEYYKQDFLRYSDRLNVPGMEFRRLLPSIFLPTYLKHTIGYRTHAMVSMPVLNPHTAVNRDFDSFELMPTHNDMAAMLERLCFDAERPSFYLLNVGETHYPFALPSEDPSTWPRLSGVHGVFEHLDEHMVGGKLMDGDEPLPQFDQAQLDRLRARQIEAVRYLDGVFERLFDLVPTVGLILYVLATAKIPHWAVTSLIVVAAVGFGLFAFAFASAREHHTSVLDEVGPLRRLVTMARYGLGVLHRPGPAAVAAFFQCLGWLCQFLAVYTAMRAFHIHAPLPAAGLVLLLMNVATLFPLWPGNIGLLQAAIALPLASYGVAAGRAVAYGFGLQAIEASVGVGVGMLFLAREGLSFAMLKRMPEASEAEVPAKRRPEASSEGEESRERARVPG